MFIVQPMGGRGAGGVRVQQLMCSRSLAGLFYYLFIIIIPSLLLHEIHLLKTEGKKTD